MVVDGWCRGKLRIGSRRLVWREAKIGNNGWCRGRSGLVVTVGVEGS